MSKQGQAGTLESNDIHIIVKEGVPGSGISIDLTSTVLLPYGDAIRTSITDVCNSFQVKDIEVTAMDKGALDCTIRARMQTALRRCGLIQEV